MAQTEPSQATGARTCEDLARRRGAFELVAAGGRGELYERFHELYERFHELYERFHLSDSGRMTALSYRIADKSLVERS